MTGSNPTPLSKLYNKLNESGQLNLPDYQSFESALQDEGSRKKFYDKLMSKGIAPNLPDYNTFSSSLGFTGNAVEDSIQRVVDAGGKLQNQEEAFEATPSRAAMIAGNTTAPVVKEEKEEDLGFWQKRWKEGKNFVVDGIKSAVGFYSSTFAGAYPMSPGAMPITGKAVEETLDAQKRFKTESKEFKKDLATWAKEFEKNNKDVKGLTTRIQDIESEVDVIDYAFNTVIQTLGSAAEAGATGGVSPFIRGIGSSYFDTLEKEAEKEGKTVEQVIMEGENNEVMSALSTGVVASLLERAGIASYMNPKMKNAVFGQSSRRMSNILKRAVVGGLGEGFTEAGQGAVQDIGSEQFATKFEASLMEQLSSSKFWIDRGEDFAAGAVGGGTIGGVKGRFEKTSSQVDRVSEAQSIVSDNIEATQDIASEQNPQLKEAKKEDLINELTKEDQEAIDKKKEKQGKQPEGKTDDKGQQEIADSEEALKDKKDKLSKSIDEQVEKIESIDSEQVQTEIPSTGDTELDTEVDEAMGVDNTPKESALEQAEVELNEEASQEILNEPEIDSDSIISPSQDILDAASTLDSTKDASTIKKPKNDSIVIPESGASKESNIAKSFETEDKTRTVPSFFEKGGELSNTKDSGLASEVRNKVVNWAKSNDIKVKSVYDAKNPYYAKVKKGDDTIYINTAVVGDKNSSVLQDIIPHEILHIAVNKGLEAGKNKMSDLKNELRTVTSEISKNIRGKYQDGLSSDLATKLDAIDRDPSEAINYAFTDEEFIREVLDTRYKTNDPETGKNVWNKLVDLIKKAAGLSGYRTDLDHIADITNKYVRLEDGSFFDSDTIANDYKIKSTEKDTSLDKDLKEIKEQYAATPNVDENKVKTLYKVARNRNKSKSPIQSFNDLVALADAINQNIALDADKITSNDIIAAYKLFKKKGELDKHKKDKKARAKADVDFTLNQVTGLGKAIPLSAKKKRAYKNNRNLNTAISKFAMNHYNIHFLFDKLSSSLGKGYKFMDNALVNTFGFQLNSSGVDKKNGIATTTQQIQKIKESIFKTGGKKMTNKQLRKRMKESKDPVNLTANFQYIDKKDGSVINDSKTIDISEQEAATRYMQYQDTTLHPTFARYGEMIKKDDGTFELTEAGKAIQDMVKPDMKKYADELLSFYDSYYNEVNAVYERNYGGSLGKINKYSPIKREADTDPVDMFDVTKNGTIKNYSLKDRTSNTNRIVLQEIDTVLGGHINKMEHFKAYADVYNRISSTFKNPKVKEAIDTYHGSHINELLNSFIDSMGSGNIVNQGSIELIDKLRNSYVVGSLAFRPVVALKQLTSIPAYAAYMPDGIRFKQYTAGLLKGTANLKKAAKIIMETDYAKARFKNSSYTDIVNGINSTFGNEGKLVDRLMSFTKWGDKWAVIVGGYPVYQATYDKAKAEGKTDAEAKKLAENKFALASENAQQASIETSSNYYQRQSGSMMRLFLAYQSSPMAYFMHIARSVGSLSTKGLTKSQKADAGKILGLYGAILPALFGSVDFGFDFSPDEKDEEKGYPINRDLFGHISTGTINGMFLIGPMLQGAMWNYWFDKNYKYSPVMFERLITDFYKNYSQTMGHFEDGIDDIKTEEVLQLLLGYGDTLGKIFPQLAAIGALKPITEGVVDIINGKTPKNYGSQKTTDIPINIFGYDLEVDDYRRLVGWTRGSLMRDDKKKKKVKRKSKFKLEF